MSAIDRIFDAVRDVVVLGSEVKRLNEEVRELAVAIRDHDRRLIRIETLIEVAGARMTTARLSGPDEV